MVFIFVNQNEAGPGNFYYAQHDLGIRHALLMMHFGHLEGDDHIAQIGFGALAPGIAALFLDPLFRAQLNIHGLNVDIGPFEDEDGVIVGVRLVSNNPNHAEVGFAIMLALNQEAFLIVRWRPGRCNPGDGRGGRGGRGGGGGRGSSALTCQMEMKMEDDYQQGRIPKSLQMPRLVLHGSGRGEGDRPSKFVDGSSCQMCWRCHGDGECKAIPMELDPSEAEKLATSFGKMSMKWNSTASDEKDIPALSEKDIPALSEKDIPALSEKDIPALNEKDIPALNEKDIPALNEKDIPASGEKDSTASNEKDSKGEKNRILLDIQKGKETVCIDSVRRPEGGLVGGNLVPTNRQRIQLSFAEGCKEELMSILKKEHGMDMEADFTMVTAEFPELLPRGKNPVLCPKVISSQEGVEILSKVCSSWVVEEGNKK